jgi:hypothetical protein
LVCSRHYDGVNRFVPAERPGAVVALAWTRILGTFHVPPLLCPTARFHDDLDLHLDLQPFGDGTH